MCSDLILDASFELSPAAMLRSTLETLCSLLFNASISDFCLCRVQPGLESRHWWMKKIVCCGEADPSGALHAHAIYVPDVKGLPERPCHICNIFLTGIFPQIYAQQEKGLLLYWWILYGQWLVLIPAPRRAMPRLPVVYLPSDSCGVKSSLQWVRTVAGDFSGCSTTFLEDNLSITFSLKELMS